MTVSVHHLSGHQSSKINLVALEISLGSGSQLTLPMLQVTSSAIACLSLALFLSCITYNVSCKIGVHTTLQRNPLKPQWKVMLMSVDVISWLKAQTSWQSLARHCTLHMTITQATCQSSAQPLFSGSGNEASHSSPHFQASPRGIRVSLSDVSVMHLSIVCPSTTPYGIRSKESITGYQLSNDIITTTIFCLKFV